MEKGDELLVEMLTGAVESKAGVRPDADDVAEFLLKLGKPGPIEPQWERLTQPPRVEPPGPVSPRVTSESSRRGKLTLLGKMHPYHNAKEAMVIILRELATSSPTFLERCSQHPDAQGRKRRYIARTPEELYPDREDLRDMRATLPGGWLVATNLNNVLKKTIVRLAVEVAGLHFGTDVVVEF